MVISRYIEDLRKLIPGILLFLGYYEIVASLRIPFNFTVNRVTYIYLIQAPLLGFFEIDLAIYLFSAATLYYEGKINPKGKSIILLIFLNLTMALSFILGATWLAHITLGLACLITAIPTNAKKNVSSLLPGFLASLLLLEAISLISLISYYMLGGWNKIFFQVVLRERLFWSPLEWGSILLLITSMWNALVYTVTGKQIISLREAKPSDGDTERNSEDKLLLISALLLITALVALPLLPTVNPEFKPISVDTAFYYSSLLREAERTGLIQALSSEGMGRPVYIVIIYWLWTLLGKNTTILMDLLHPLVALIGLSLTSFYITYKIGGREAAGWTALLIPLGYAQAGFLAGGFQANSMALIPALLAITIDPKGIKSWLTLTTLLTITGLVHPWTHLMYSAAIAAHNLRSKRKLTLSIAAFALSYCIVYAVNSALTSGSYRAETPIMPLMEYAGFYIPRSWFEAIRLWIWNTLSNPIYMSMTILSFNPVSASIMGIAAPLTLILNTPMILRIILNLPIHIQASNFLVRVKDKRAKNLIILVLLVRVLGNLTGLTPLATNI